MDYLLVIFGLFLCFEIFLTEVTIDVERDAKLTPVKFNDSLLLLLFPLNFQFCQNDDEWDKRVCSRVN